MGTMMATGCDTGPEPVDLDAEERAYYMAYTGWGCPSCRYKNSPHFGLHPIADFQRGSGASSGFALAEIEDPSGNRYPVDFDGSALVAFTSAGDLTGIDLLDWRLVFELGGSEFRVRVMGFEKHLDWTGGDVVPTYALAAEVGPQGEATLESVCPGLSFEETNVVFTPGETYDPVSLTVDPTAGDRVSMACRGHAVAKLKFLGHDPNDSYGSSPEARQATLKMLTADYCGDGTSHTTVGHPLSFRDDLGLFKPSHFGIPGDMEARWDDNGAVCLSEPRNAALVRDDVHCADALPKCEGPGLDGALWASYAFKTP